MGQKTWACPSCTCLNTLPAVDDDGADVNCVACKLPVHITNTGELEHAAVAPKS